MQPLIAQTHPQARNTAEAHLLLSGSVDESEPKRIRYTRGVELVGVKISISCDGPPAGGRRRPTLDDLLVRIDSTELPIIKASDEEGYDKYVSATAIDISSRYLMAQLPGSPDITVQVRWKNEDNTVPIFEDSIISIALLYNPTEG